jgi:hypothetical protein
MLIPEGPERWLGLDDGAQPFVADVALAEGAALRPIAPRGAAWPLPACPASGCRVRYRYHLAEAAEAMDSPDYVARYANAFVGAPSSWLLRPLDPAPPDAPGTTPDTAAPPRFRLRVATPEGIHFATGLFPAPTEPAAVEAPLGDLEMAPYSAFGPLRTMRLDMPQGAVQIGILPGPLEIDDVELSRWVARAARSVSAYYGRFPVRHALVLLVPSGMNVPRGASTTGHGGASILAPVNRATSADDLADDWQMTHEMVHLAFPNVARRHAWIEEGLATYVEPIARARLGLLPAERVWRDLYLNLPKGRPMPGDRGLDNTPTWGRTYWGGALFCLLADLEIRERTGNTRSLDDALRGILAAGGDITVSWGIERVFAEGDRATGVPVLAALYRHMKDDPADVDLDALFRRLGIAFHRGRAVLDDSAPLATIRDAIAGRPTPARP